MNNMQAFYEWLSAAGKTWNDYQDCLARLNCLNRDQILHATGELSWFIWNAAESA